MLNIGFFIPAPKSCCLPFYTTFALKSYIKLPNFLVKECFSLFVETVPHRLYLCHEVYGSHSPTPLLVCHGVSKTSTPSLMGPRPQSLGRGLLLDARCRQHYKKLFCTTIYINQMFRHAVILKAIQSYTNRSECSYVTCFFPPRWWQNGRGRIKINIGHVNNTCPPAYEYSRSFHSYNCRLACPAGSARKVYSIKFELSWEVEKRAFRRKVAQCV